MVTFSWFMPRQILGFLNHLFFLGMGWCLLLLLYKDARIPSTTLADRNKVRACPAASASAETDSITANCSCICISCSWCHNNSTSTWLPPFPLRLVRREKGRCLEIPFEILPVRHRFIKAMTVRACTHLYQPCHHIKGKNEKEFQRGALIHPFPYFSVHTRMHARAHTHLPSLEINGLLLRPLVRSCAAGKTCTIPHCAQRWTTESATPISAISLENNEAATQGLWNGPIKGQDSLPRHGASWPKDKRVLSLIRVAADKSAFPMRSITATGSEPLSTPLSWLSVMKPPDTDKTSARTNVALVLFFFFLRGDLAAYAAKWLKTEATWQTHHTALAGTGTGNLSSRLQGGASHYWVIQEKLPQLCPGTCAWESACCVLQPIPSFSPRSLIGLGERGVEVF